MDLFLFNCFFGTVKQNTDGSWAEVEQDDAGWGGQSDLIVTVPILTEYLEYEILAPADGSSNILPMTDNELEWIVR